jgi:ribosomal protein L31|tara:strand:+ start:500 stop:727 length:228 start_codon:yes stop_codon:yes gene_type:complete
MKVNFKNKKRTWVQLTDGSAISTNYLFEKAYTKLDLDIKAHKLWRFNVNNVTELSNIDKRILNFNKRFKKKNNNR